VKAAKLAPTPEMIGAAAYVVDLLTPGVQHPNKRTDEEDRIIRDVLHDAIKEYLRRFPTARNKGRTWHTQATYETSIDGRRKRVIEWDYQCLCCRKSLNTLPPGGGSLPVAFVRSLEAHSDLCAAMFLAGMIPGKHPSQDKKRRKRS
jgi:hypothetical protein